MTKGPPSMRRLTGTHDELSAVISSGQVLGSGFSLNASLSATDRNLSASADSRLVFHYIMFPLRRERKQGALHASKKGDPLGRPFRLTRSRDRDY